MKPSGGSTPFIPYVTKIQFTQDKSNYEDCDGQIRQRACVRQRQRDQQIKDERALWTPEQQSRGYVTSAEQANIEAALQKRRDDERRAREQEAQRERNEIARAQQQAAMERQQEAKEAEARRNQREALKRELKITEGDMKLMESNYELRDYTTKSVPSCYDPAKLREEQRQRDEAARIEGEKRNAEYEAARIELAIRRAENERIERIERERESESVPESAFWSCHYTFSSPSRNPPSEFHYQVSDNPTGRLKMDGTPDMRYKANRK